MRTIISLTMLPSRLEKSKDCIQSLLTQTIPVDIYLWLPKICHRTKEKITTTPDFLKNERIHVQLVEDLGSITKIYYALQKFKDDKDINIITVDDDVKYPKTFVENMITYSNKFPKNALCYRGRVIEKNNQDYNYSKLIKGVDIQAPMKVDIITGTWGVLYKPYFFKEISSILVEDKILRLTDDIVISAQLKANKIEALVIPIKEQILPLDTHKLTPLWEHNKDGKNNNYALNYYKNNF